MKAGGIGAVRMAVPWSSIQEKNKKGVYNWTGLDEGVGIAARAGLRVLPFLYGTPHWLAAKPTTLPIDNARQRSEWKAFLTAAVRRYGPGGEFWAKHSPGGGVGVPYVPYEPATPKRRLRSAGRCRSAPGRSGTRPTSSTSPTPPRRAATRACSSPRARRSKRPTRGRR